jgi:hypothetical protein
LQPRHEVIVISKYCNSYQTNLNPGYVAIDDLQALFPVNSYDTLVKMIEEVRKI